MNWRAYSACVRRELQRGRRSLLVFLGVALTGVTLVFVLSGAWTMLPATLALIGGIFALFAPSADLGQDRLLGHFEFDRALPLPSRLVAAGRLTGAAVRTVPFPLGAMAFGVALARSSDSTGPLPTLLVSAGTLGAMLVGFLLCWTLLALNSRWAFRRIWWLGPTIGLAPQLVPAFLPASVRGAIATSASALGANLLDIVAQPVGLVAVLVILAMLPVMVFSGATMLFASGIRRYRYDPTALHLGQHGSLPTRELAAIGRGPALAVARLRLRLSLEQFRREFILIAILLVVVAFNPGGLRDFARGYVRVLAALIPGGIVIQLGTARAKGFLETMQHLPHPARVVGLGHLAAIAVLAVPGSLVLVLDRLLTGELLSPAAVLAVWGWFVTMAWLAAALSIWMRVRYAAVLVAVPLLMVGGWLALVGASRIGAQLSSAWHAFALLRLEAGVALPLGAMVVAIAVGLPIFARGLASYEYKGS